MDINRGLRVVLGSSSPYRQQLLREMGYEFEVIAPDINEQDIRYEDPVRLALALAEAKAEAVAGKVGPGYLVITADQVVSHGNTIREKPTSVDEARHFLKTASETPAETVSAICVTQTTTGKRASGVDIVRIYLRPLPDELIERLIVEGEVFHCAGGMQIENPLVEPYVERIEGTLDSIMGLPKALVRRLIEEVA